MTENDALGEQMYSWIKDLLPINRSLTGDGVRQTLSYLKTLVPKIAIHEVPTGTAAFDWIVPDEWNIREAYVEDQTGRRVIDFRANPLHVVGYSEPVDRWLDRDALQGHLHSIPELPDAIPYLTSYYSRTWGFCLSQRARDELKPGMYHAVVESTLAPGHLTYGEVRLAGESSQEVFISTYVCHPAMANDNLSGPVVAVALARWLAARARRLSYRIVFVPETLGSLVYLSRHLPEMQRNVIAGYVLTCLGDERCYSLLASRRGNTLADRVARHVLRHHAGEFIEYDYRWPNRGSDERNYCMPGIDLPVASIMRSKYATYPEYHTSLDDLGLISPRGLESSVALLKKCLLVLESNHRYRTTILGEPQLARRELYPTGLAHRAGFGTELSMLMNVLAYSDGDLDLVGLAELIGADALQCIPVIERLVAHQLLQRVDSE